MVYGATPEETEHLRSHTGGLMKIDDGGFLLSDPDTMVLAGDKRAAEQPGLLSLHTLFVREHNRQAGIIAKHQILISLTSIRKPTMVKYQTSLQLLHIDLDIHLSAKKLLLSKLMAALNKFHWMRFSLSRNLLKKKALALFFLAKANKHQRKLTIKSSTAFAIDYSDL